MTTAPTVDRFVGCLLGLMVGDALGAPFEGLSADLIYNSFGRSRQIVERPPVETLCYTDDTQMMIGVAEVLCECGRVDQRSAKRFVTNYDPRRGYGQGTRQWIGAVADGADWQAQSRAMFDGVGSYGNGGAMRVAPVGLLFCDDIDRVWQEAGHSAEVTHSHEWAIEGAQLIAVAVALGVNDPALDRRRLLGELSRLARTEEYQWSLGVAARLKPGDSPALLGNSLEAHRSVVTAIACFAAAPDDFSGVIAKAIALGNDVDTIAAMSGAISGARLGQAGIPANLVNRLEDQGKGRTYVIELAHRLHQRFLEKRAGRSTPGT